MELSIRIANAAQAALTAKAKRIGGKIAPYMVDSITLAALVASQHGATERALYAQIQRDAENLLQQQRNAHHAVRQLIAKISDPDSQPLLMQRQAF